MWNTITQKNKKLCYIEFIRMIFKRFNKFRKIFLKTKVFEGLSTFNESVSKKTVKLKKKNDLIEMENSIKNGDNK